MVQSCPNLRLKHSRLFLRIHTNATTATTAVAIPPAHVATWTTKPTRALVALPPQHQGYCSHDEKHDEKDQVDPPLHSSLLLSPAASSFAETICFVGLSLRFNPSC